MIHARKQTLAGFFYTTDGSTLTVENSKLSGTYGDVASAFYATADSVLNIFHMHVTDLDGPVDCKFEKAGVVVADFAK